MTKLQALITAGYWAGRQPDGRWLVGRELDRNSHVDKMFRQLPTVAEADALLGPSRYPSRDRAGIAGE